MMQLCVGVSLEHHADEGVGLTICNDDIDAAEFCDGILDPSFYGG